MDLLDKLAENTEQAAWSNPMPLVRHYACLARPFMERVKQASKRPEFVLLQPEKNAIYATGDASEFADQYQVHPLTHLPPGFGVEPWMPIKTAADSSAPFHPVLSALQLVDNPVNAFVGGPTPLASMVSGGLLGAGLGYGGGWLLEKLFGNDLLENGRLRQTGALLGGLVGAAPGLVTGLAGASVERDLGNNPLSAFWKRNKIFGEVTDPYPPADAIKTNIGIKTSMEHAIEKFADAGTFFAPRINVPSFDQALMKDSNSPLQLQAATSLLMNAASQARNSDYVSPWDVTRMALGMGSGYLSGKLVGSVLGSLAGLKPEAQQKLQQAGTWAGLLRTVIPSAFGM